MFAAGVAALATQVQIEVLAALSEREQHRRALAMTARGQAGREVRAEGIDVLQTDANGLIVRAEGYWNAAAFRQSLAAS